MTNKTNISTFNSRFRTESGFVFDSIDLAWNSWGKLNDEKDNVVLIFHALTGDSNAADWFQGFFSPSGIFNPETDFILCINNLGSCYGSTGPTSINPKTGKPYQADFPEITIRDIVASQQLLLDKLEIKGIKTAIGGSMGGMIGLEFALTDERIKSLAVLASCASHSAWAIGISHAQRQAIYADKNWNNGFYDVENPPQKGLEAARSLAMITYRSPNNYQHKFGRTKRHKNQFNVESYLDYQGYKFNNRFDANSYITLTKAMDTHDLANHGESAESVLKKLEIPVLIIGISSDLLYPTNEQKFLAEHIPNSHYQEIDSLFGHDAFLIEFDQINKYLLTFLDLHQHNNEHYCYQIS